MPQGVNGLRKLRTTVIRHFPAQEKNCQKSLGGGLLLGLEYAEEKQHNSRKVAKLAKKNNLEFLIWWGFKVWEECG